MLSFQFIKYILVGVSNTLVTIGVILFLTYQGFNLYIANAIGYIIGILNSYIFNSVFTFMAKVTVVRIIKFIVVCLISYLFNFIFIYIVKDLVDNIYMVQIMGMIVYTLIGFILNKAWVMK